MLVLPFPNFDPVLVQMGPLKIHWYGLAYAAGIVLGWKYALYLAKRYVPTILPQYLDGFVTWIVVGIVVGGRFGHILFYDLSHYISHPVEILMTWKGGMSFHGGLAGAVIAAFIYCRRLRIPLFVFGDILTSACTIGLGLGRITNFINAELYGITTDLPWGVVFPNAGAMPRHPSQLYEAFGEGALLWIVLHQAWKIPGLRSQPGRITGLFFMGYGIVRFLVEYVREPEIIYAVAGCAITQGQVLSLPLIALGAWWLRRQAKKN
ncbi:prolipoprotein diacylglyceryl transferase [Candidatus Finniella inopinata]|nr:prolipoprotein diacylglyceryl transferase [Candidatus Finniella inopinata]